MSGWRFSGQSRAMGQQPEQRYLLDRTERVADRAELGDETNNRVVESKLALVAQLHDSRRGEGLADRRDQEQRVLVHCATARDIRHPEALLEDQFLIAHHANRKTRRAFLRDDLRD